MVLKTLPLHSLLYRHTQKNEMTHKRIKRINSCENDVEYNSYKHVICIICIYISVVRGRTIKVHNLGKFLNAQLRFKIFVFTNIYHSKIENTKHFVVYKRNSANI